MKLDNRNIFSIFISIFKKKIDIISIIFYPEEFSHYSLTLANFSFEFLFNYFMNALLYSDDVVSQKYHNNGQLEFITSLTLSLLSNIISSIFSWIIEKLSFYTEYLTFLNKDIQIKNLYITIFRKLYGFIKFKIICFYIIIFISSIFMTYYLFLFCYIYQKSQVSLLTNYFLGTLETLLKSLGVSIIVCILRFTGLKFKLKNIYRTSMYLDGKF